MFFRDISLSVFNSVIDIFSQKCGPVVFSILPVCTTATAYTFAFEFDLVMDFMAIFSNKQAVSTGGKTYDTTIYKVWKHVAWWKHAVNLWQYVEDRTGWMSFAWNSFDHNCQYPAVAVETPTENQFTQWVNTQHYFVSLKGVFWGYTPVKQCLTAEFNIPMVLCKTSNIVIPVDMRF